MADFDPESAATTADAPSEGGPAAARSGRGQRDLTQGPVFTTLIAFALPTLGSNILQSLNASINSVWVGRFLGEEALAATANANTIMFLMFAAVFGFGMAATVLVGQATGRSDMDAARRAFGSAVGFCLILAVLVAVLGYVASDSILRVLGTPAASFALAHDYLRISFVAMPFSLLAVMVMMGLRGTGDSLTPLRFMLLSVAIDLVMNPVLILGLGPFPRLGITGSALSTALAGAISLGAMIAYIYARDLPLRLRGGELAYLKPLWRELRFIVIKGLPMGAQMLVISAAGLIMIGLVNREGLLTAAAFGASLQLWTYVQMPALAIGAGVSSMAAQNIGAGRWDRVGRTTGAGIVANLLMTGGLVAILLLFDRPAMALFLGSGSPALVIGRHIQLIASWSFILFGALIVLISTMRANGYVIGPLLVLAIALYPVRLGFYGLRRPALGADAIWWSFPVGSLASLAIAGWMYWHGAWRSAPTPASPAEAAEGAQATGLVTGRDKPEL